MITLDAKPLKRKMGPEGLLWADDRDEYTLKQKVGMAIHAFERRLKRKAVRVAVSAGDVPATWVEFPVTDGPVATVRGVDVYADGSVTPGHIFVT